MAALISTSIIACLKSFNDFIDEIRHLQDREVRGLDRSAWEDELGRLRMWAANIGAHQTGQSSLDFRLRDASHVREQIIKLLQGLLRRLRDARDVLADGRESDHEDDTEDEDEDEEDQKTEIQELQESLTTNVNCLFQMSILVRKPAQHDLYLGSRCADVAVFERFDCTLVKHKFPKADDALVRRLGSAITRRRKYLKYRERLATESRKGVGNVDPAARDVQEIDVGEITQSITRVVVPDYYVRNLEQRNIVFDDKASDTGIPQTYYMPASLSGRNIALPAPSEDTLDGEPFECPYCFQFVAVSEKRSWNNHVLQDLQPYVCIDSTCTSPGKLYSTKHEWIHHLRVAHPATPTHGGTSKDRNGLIACPLCKEEIESGGYHDDHVACHLLELALLTLPARVKYFESGEFHDADPTSNTEYDHSAASRDGSEPPRGLPAIPATHSAATGTTKSLYAEYSNQEYWIGRDPYEREKAKHSEITERVGLLGPEHRDTLSSMTDLAILFSYRKAYGEASHWERQVMETKKRLLGAEHPETLDSMAYLAQYVQGRKQSIDAEMMSQRALDGYEKTFGPDHRVTLSAVEDLGGLYKEQGNFAKAEVMYERALNGNTISLGSDHTITLFTIHNLGKLYEQQNKLAEAEVRYLQALNGYAKTLGPDHTMTLNMCNDLGRLYEKEINFREAEAMYERALNGYTKSLGSDHKLTLSTIDKLGHLYEQQNKLAQAEAMYERVLDGYRRTLGPDDPTTVAAAKTLRSIY